MDQPVDQPVIIVFSGLPGSGKSTLAGAVAQTLGLPLFSVDPIESAILTVGITRSWETGVAAYSVAQTLAKEQLKLGISVILDAVSAAAEAKDVWRSLAAEAGLKLIIIETYIADLDEHKARIENRVRQLPGIPEVTWEYVQARRSEYQPWAEEILLINAAMQAAANCLDVINYIRVKSGL